LKDQLGLWRPHLDLQTPPEGPKPGILLTTILPGALCKYSEIKQRSMKAAAVRVMLLHCPTLR